MITLRILLALSLCFLLSACVESESPLSPPGPLPPDSPLIGSWLYQSKDETAYLHIGNEGQDIKMVEVEIDAHGVLKSEIYTASAVTLGGHDYLSFQTPRDSRTLYTLMKYRLVDKDTLTLSLADYKFMETAVKDGLVAGTLGSSGVLLTAGQDALQRFVVDHDSQIFPEATSQLRRLP